MTNKTIVLMGLSILLLGAHAPVPASDADAAMKAFDAGAYLSGSDRLAAAAFRPDGTVRDDLTFQMWEQLSPMVTNELDPAVFDRANPHATRGDPRWTERIAAAVPHDAITEISRRARATSIVILNEAHDSPRDRAFALQVALALRPLGYSVLAAETFDNGPGKTGEGSSMDHLRRDGVVRRSTGYYTRDPVFAGFIRQALAAGYQPVAYEQTGEPPAPKPGVDPRRYSIESREQTEAKNLAAIRAARPTDKILVYVGYSHAAKAPIAFGEHGATIEWMAARLKRMTGVDPLTIDQTGLTDLSATTRPAYAQAAARIGNDDAVLFENDRPLVLDQYASAVDLQVVHPARAYRYGRPTWLALLGGKPLTIPPYLLPSKGRRLIQAYRANDPTDAVPLDQVIVRAGAPAPSLMVPEGPVRFAIGS